MGRRKATPRSGGYCGASGSCSIKPHAIVPHSTGDWERGTFLAGMLMAVSFGSMFLYAGAFL